MASVNPFEAALAQVTFLPEAPATYKYRLGLQLALLALLLVLSFTYVLIHCMNARASSAPCWLFKLQKHPDRSRGSSIMVNSMLVFAILAFLAAGGQFGSRYYEWMVFVENYPPHGYTAAQFCPWVPVFVQAWTFSLTNLEATVATRSQINSKLRQFSHPWIHNFLLIGMPIIYIASILPVALVTSHKQDKLLDSVTAMKAMLEAAGAAFAANGSMDMKLIGQITAASTALESQSSTFKTFVVVLCAMCQALAAIVGVMNLFNLLLVISLRQSIKAAKARTSSGAYNSDEKKSATADRNSRFSLSSSIVKITHNRTSKEYTTKPASFACTSQLPSSEIGSTLPFSPTPQDVAMRRLAADLSIVIPSVLIMVTIMVCGLSILVDRRFDITTWSLHEFTMDGFCYVYTTISIIAMSFLLWNLVNARAIQKAVGPLDTGSFGKSEGSRGEKVLPAPLPVVIERGDSASDLTAGSERDCV